MLGWAVTFLIIAIIAALLGFGAIAGVAVEANRADVLRDFFPLGDGERGLALVCVVYEFDKGIAAHARAA